MDSMVNRYTADRRIRKNDSYTPDDEGGKRPDRAVIVYAQRCREAYKNTPIIIGGIEASLRRIAHYDYWSDKVRRSVLLDGKADLLVYGNAERAIVEIAHRASRGEAPSDMHDVRGTAFALSDVPEGWSVLDQHDIDIEGERFVSPRQTDEKTVVRLPAFEQVRDEVTWNEMRHRGGVVPRLIAIQGTLDPADDETYPVYSTRQKGCPKRGALGIRG